MNENFIVDNISQSPYFSDPKFLVLEYADDILTKTREFLEQEGNITSAAFLFYKEGDYLHIDLCGLVFDATHLDVLTQYLRNSCKEKNCFAVLVIGMSLGIYPREERKKGLKLLDKYLTGQNDKDIVKIVTLTIEFPGEYYAGSYPIFEKDGIKTFNKGVMNLQQMKLFGTLTDLLPQNSSPSS